VRVGLREEQRLRVFENRVLRKIIWANGDEVTGRRRKLHKEKLNYLYSSLNVTRSDQINKNRMYQIFGEKMRYEFWWGGLRERGHLEDPSVDRSSTLKLIFKTWNGDARNGMLWLRIGTGDRL
jgi:hypothetical protein